MMSRGGFGGGGAPVQINDPYLEFAGDWAWAMFDRTISPIMRGDEALALPRRGSSLKCSRKWKPSAPSAVFLHSNIMISATQEGKAIFGFLEQLPQILADLERRANEPAKTNIIDAGITNQPDQTKRITALVDDLDLVSARQWGQPGGVNFPEDPIVAALIQEGDPAVEPLLNCLENDKRLTRSVGFGRDFFRSRTVIPVHDAARAACYPSFAPGSLMTCRRFAPTGTNTKVSSSKTAGMPSSTTTSAQARWGEAAANIVQPENVRRNGLVDSAFQGPRRPMRRFAWTARCYAPKQILLFPN